MKATVEAITLFTHPFDGGIDCPKCGKRTEILATTSEWKYWCKSCDVRFNLEGVEYK